MERSELSELEHALEHAWIRQQEHAKADWLSAIVADRHIIPAWASKQLSDEIAQLTDAVQAANPNQSYGTRPEDLGIVVMAQQFIPSVVSPHLH